MKIKKVNLLKFGSLTTDFEEKKSNTNSPTGYFLYPTKVKFIDQTDKLQGVKGLKFGIEYHIEGSSNTQKEVARFVCKILHPKLTNPITKKSFIETTELKSDYVNDSNFDYLYFEYDWEIKKGEYKFQILEEDRILLEKLFEIY